MSEIQIALGIVGTAAFGLYWKYRRFVS